MLDAQCHDRLTDATLRVATLADLSFVTSLARKHTEAVGFLPRPAVEWYIANSRVIIATENADNAGYLLGRSHFRWQPLLRPITQAAICFDAQRRHLGLSLVSHVADQARSAGQIGVQCCCADGLDANLFWAAAGFQQICTLSRANARDRQIHVWRLPLAKRLPLWWIQPPPRAGIRAASTVLSHRTNHLPRPR